MVISHKYQFIFIKTRKTAGTSIEVFLSRVGGEDDILLPLRPAEAGHRPRNYDKDCFRNNKNGFRNHISARKIRPLLPASVWEHYFKFCVERNPWDKCLSDYHWRKGRYATERDMTLEQYFAINPRGLPKDFDLYTDIGGQLMVDQVLRYETLNQGLGEVFEHLGIPFDGSLQVDAKGGYRPDRRHYREVLSSAQAEQIRAAFQREIAMFGYVY